MLKVESTNICSYKYSNNCINVTDVLNVFWEKKKPIEMPKAHERNLSL